MIHRSAEETLRRLAAQFPIVAITGPRQSSKSTLAKAVFPNKRCVSFNDRAMRDLALANPADFIAAFPDGAIIEEAEMVPDIFDALKLHADNSQFTPGKFILTSSAKFRIGQNMTDSMCGRAAFLKLLPFSVKELKDASTLPDNPYDVIFGGQYPPLRDPENHVIPEDITQAVGV